MAVIVGWDPERGVRWLPLFRAAAAAIEAEGTGITPWVTRDDSHLTAGTRVHLMLQGAERGIVGVGTVCSAPFLSFTGENGSGPVAPHVMVAWSALLPDDDRITVAELSARVPGVDWSAIYGRELPLDDEATDRLERLWVAPHPSAGAGPARRCAARRLIAGPSRRTSAKPAEATLRAAVS